MKLFYAIAIVLLVLVSACAQQTNVPVVSPEPGPTTEPTAEPEEAGTGMAVPGEEGVVETVVKGTTNEVRILGEEGFEPTELTINAGSAVTWFNDDEKTFTLTIFKDGKWYLNSNVMKPGDRFEHTFTEKGTYEHWTLAYGQMGAKIIVE